MLDIAQKYTNELKIKLADIAYDLKYMFVHFGYSNEYEPTKSTWDKHEFVSMSNGEVIGYIRYYINRNEYSASGLSAINFSNNKITFGRDLGTVLDNIFTKFNFRKLKFGVFIGNPIEKSYDKAIEKYGGRIIGIEKKETRLLDGNFYDYKSYEIFREDYLANKAKRTIKQKKDDNMARIFRSGDNVIWNNKEKKIKAIIHHFSEDGLITVAWLIANPDDVGYDSIGSWYKVDLDDIEPY